MIKEVFDLLLQNENAVMLAARAVAPVFLAVGARLGYRAFLHSVGVPKHEVERKSEYSTFRFTGYLSILGSLYAENFKFPASNVGWAVFVSEIFIFLLISYTAYALIKYLGIPILEKKYKTKINFF